jgi:hypothetical protein
MVPVSSVRYLPVLYDGLLLCLDCQLVQARRSGCTVSLVVPHTTTNHTKSNNDHTHTTPPLFERPRIRILSILAQISIRRNFSNFEFSCFHAELKDTILATQSISANEYRTGSLVRSRVDVVVLVNGGPNEHKICVVAPIHTSP